MEDVFLMVIVIVTVSCAAGVANNYIKMKRETGANEDDHHAYESEIDELRSRIEVLEKIVTDQKFQLNRELNELERQA